MWEVLRGQLTQAAVPWISGAPTHRGPFHILCPPQFHKTLAQSCCEELLRKAVESPSRREKAFRQKCRGIEI